MCEQGRAETSLAIAGIGKEVTRMKKGDSGGRGEDFKER